MRDLIIDFETESEEDIKLGAYAYCVHPSTEVMCISWRFLDEAPGTERCWYPDADINPEYLDAVKNLEGLPYDKIAKRKELPPPMVDRDDNSIPAELRESIIRGDRWWSFNAFFERCAWYFIMFKKYGWKTPMRFDHWWCASALAAYYGFPQNLERCCKALKLPITKDLEGGTLMKAMCKPSKRSKKVLAAWDHALVKLGQYCNVDVAAAAEIIKALPEFPKSEREIWLLDQEVNWLGLPFDKELVSAAAACHDVILEDACEKITEITDGAVTTPGQRDKIINWINERNDDEILHNLRAPTVQRMLDDIFIGEDVERLLLVRQDAAAAPVKKFLKMAKVLTHCDRFHGGYVYYGTHTGRWTGKIVQPSNLPRAHFNSEDEVEAGVSAVISQNLEQIEMVDKLSRDALKKKKGSKWSHADDWRPSASNTLTKCVRPSITASDGKVFVANDFSGVELRLLTWFVRDTRTLQRIIEHGSSQLYLDMAEKIFGCRVTKDDTFRYTVGKAGRLGCGYGMGPYNKTKTKGIWVVRLNEEGKPFGGFIEYADGYGIEVSTELADKTVITYRKNNPLVAGKNGAWKKIERRVINVIEERVTMSYNGVQFAMKGEHLEIKLPSGRCLYFAYANVDLSHGRKSIYYYTDKQGKWVKTHAHGGLFTGHIVQSMSRDLLCPSMLTISEHYPIVSHTYDEIVCEVEEDEADECMEFMTEVMCRRLPWCKSLPLEVEGWIDRRYKK